MVVTQKCPILRGHGGVGDHIQHGCSMLQVYQVGKIRNAGVPRAGQGSDIEAMLGRGGARRDVAGEVGLDRARLGGVGRGEARRGGERRGSARRGEARQGVGMEGRARRGDAG